MDDSCECGDAAEVFMTMDGEPLPNPMCFDCFFFMTTMTDGYEAEPLEEQPVILAAMSPPRHGKRLLSDQENRQQ
ncbi:MAG: hypothetical protein GY803_21990 [Chloroflexi bacterium]|nr:hypothetical protein [Chloroflexota bacterium]